MQPLHLLSDPYKAFVEVLLLGQQCQTSEFHLFGSSAAALVGVVGTGFSESQVSGLTL